MSSGCRWVPGRLAAEYFSMPYKTLLSLASRGRLPRGSFIKLGRSVRFDLGLIETSAMLHGKKIK